MLFDLLADLLAQEQRRDLEKLASSVGARLTGFGVVRDMLALRFADGARATLRVDGLDAVLEELVRATSHQGCFVGGDLLSVQPDELVLRGAFDVVIRTA